MFPGAPPQGGKRGRGTDKTPVLVGEQGSSQFVKVQVIPNVKGDTHVEFGKAHIELDTPISSDTYRSYHTLTKEFNHEPIKFDVKDNPDQLKGIIQ